MDGVIAMIHFQFHFVMDWIFLLKVCFLGIVMHAQQIMISIMTVPRIVQVLWRVSL
jgi:hypothetical protein